MSVLNVVEMWIDHGAIGTEPPTEINVRVRAGSIDGTVLGESSPVLAVDDTFAPLRFDFPAPIVLTPGATYVLEPVVLGSGNPMICGSQTPDYPGGQAILRGTRSGVDLWFQTGATEDVPAATTTWGTLKALFGR